MAKSAKASRPPTRKMRCAIYTRKSSEEGLEQAFNSLDAQREACAAFVLSQKHEGWTVLPALYDDGALSAMLSQCDTEGIFFGQPCYPVTFLTETIV